MQYTTLGNSDLTVSRICLGCMGFGKPEAGMHSWTLPEEQSREIIQHALELGVNFFDTAMGYQGGTSEEFVGRAMRDYAKREDVVLATKFIPRTPAEIEQNISGRQHIRNMLDASLRRMGLDYIDLYIYHMWDYHTPVEEIMQGLNDAVQAGKARYIGISNCFAWQLAKANEIAKHAQEEYSTAMANFVARVEIAIERKKRDLDSEIPLPRKPRDPNQLASEPDYDTLTDVQKANIEIKEAILDTLRDYGGKMTLTDIMSHCDAASTLSNQRVSALVRQLVTDGSVERSEERRLAYFEAVD